MDRTRVKFPSGNLLLEGEWLLPEGPGPFPAVVIAHPFPPQGGTMESSVVLAVWQELAGQSIAAFRFNFRGVGESEGEFDNGNGEMEDVKAAFDYVRSAEKIDPAKVSLAGYSFGAMMSTLAVLTDVQVHSLALISAPLPEPVWRRLDSFNKPYLVTAGENDHLVDMELFKARMKDTPGAGRYRLLPGADHFLFGYEDKVASTVSEFFTDVFGIRKQD